MTRGVVTGVSTVAASVTNPLVVVSPIGPGGSGGTEGAGGGVRGGGRSGVEFVEKPPPPHAETQAAADAINDQ